jgi:DNA-binding response OmpR family regulator
MTAKKPTPPVKMPDGRVPRALVIDDDAFIAGIYVISLKTAGIEVEAADNGEDGIIAAKQKGPDIILLDILMPGIDGFETLKRLKADAATAKIPVIILTSLAQNEDIDRGLKLGASAYLKKTQTLPVDALAKIKETLKLV